MNTTDDSGLIIEESRNIGDDAIEADDTTHESSELFDSVMQKQGISIEASYASLDATNKDIADFSRELLAEGGIEIVSSEDGEEHYA